MKNIAFFALFAVAGILSATPVTVSADLLNAGTTLLASDGYYVGPYTLSINGVSYAAMCVDFTDEGVIGQHYSAYETQVGGNLSNTYNPTFGQQYEEEAYLMSLILKPGADRIGIQHAAWAITDSSYAATGTAATYLSQAMADYNTVNFGQFDIISDINKTSGNRSQEYMIDGAASPEPASMLLLGGGLLVVGLARRKVAKKA